MAHRTLKIAGGLLALGGLAVVGGAAYLWIAPPDLLRVGTNYSAKMVCSNVFLAGRDPEEVLAIDVQAPGHPLLKYISVETDEAAQQVTAHFLGLFAAATSHYRAGLGCTNVSDATLSDAAQPVPVPVPLREGIWPEGNTVALTDTDTDRAIARILSDPALLGEGWRAVVVVKDGRIAGEAYAPGFDAGTPQLGWSMTKSVVAGLIGTLIADGQMSLNDDLTASYPDWAGDARQEVSLASMLGMQSGLEWNEDYGNVSDVTRMLYLNDDMAGFAASQPAAAPVDSVFNYSSGTTTMLSRAFQDVVERGGGDSLSYPRRALFDPLGMTSAVMETDATDTFVGSSYMYATARDWARYGQFLLQGGRWEGQQILPEGYTDWMAEPVAVSDDRYGKGHVWREGDDDTPPPAGAIWMRGHDGQTVGILPQENMVVVRLGLTPSRLGYSPMPLTEALIGAFAEAPAE